MKNKRNKKAVFNPYVTYTDDQLLASIESYLIYKKSCEVARMLVVEYCHDSYETVDTSVEESKFNSCLSVALSRNIPVDLSNNDLKCSTNDVAKVLLHMCGLELSWLDEHRHELVDTDFTFEEEDILLFYKSMICELSDEQIFEVEKRISGDFALML